MHDILEAVVGSLPAPGEKPDSGVTRREDGSWLVDGMLPIFEFKEIIESGTFRGTGRRIHNRGRICPGAARPDSGSGRPLQRRGSSLRDCGPRWKANRQSPRDRTATPGMTSVATSGPGARAPLPQESPGFGDYGHRESGETFISGLS